MLVNCDPAQAHPSAHALALLDRHRAAAVDLHRQVKHAQWNVGGRGAVARAHASAVIEAMEAVVDSLRGAYGRGAASEVIA